MIGSGEFSDRPETVILQQIKNCDLALVFHFRTAPYNSRFVQFEINDTFDLIHCYYLWFRPRRRATDRA